MGEVKQGGKRYYSDGSSNFQFTGSVWSEKNIHLAIEIESLESKDALRNRYTEKEGYVGVYSRIVSLEIEEAGTCEEIAFLFVSR